MKDQVDLKRRRLLIATGVGAALATTAAFPIVLKKRAFRREGGEATPAFAPDVEIELTARPARVQILPGPATLVWRYEGRVLKGNPDAVTPMPQTYLGPVLKFRTGQRVRIHLHNRLPQRFITHWHGMHVPFEADGHPSFAVEPGRTYVYEFTVENRASTNWYHPHTNMVTGAQAYAGLAGMIIVEDEEERQLPLPRGEYDVPLVLQDRTFSDNNQLLYDNRGPLTMLGFLGERIMVNGRPDFVAGVAGRAYRFRILNGSNSRVYKLAWNDGDPITVIGTDGGLLERPVTRPYLMIGPGERYEIWKDFRSVQGREVALESLEYRGAMPPMYERMLAGQGMGMMGERGGMMGAVSGPRGMMGAVGPMGVLSRHLPQGSRFPVARFRVTRKAGDNVPLPQRLRALPKLRVEDTVNPGKPRPIAIGNRGRRFTLNGEVFEMDGALPVETFPVNTTHLMEIFHAHGEMEREGEHSTGPSSSMMGMGGMPGMGRMRGMSGMGGMNMAMMMAMVHPIHIHGHYFQIVRRQPPARGEMHGSEGYDTVREGFVDDGFQDTVLAMPGERITLIKPFDKYKGLFLYHCHNLEHEDAEMMRNFKVV